LFDLARIDLRFVGALQLPVLVGHALEDQSFTLGGIALDLQGIDLIADFLDLLVGAGRFVQGTQGIILGRTVRTNRHDDDENDQPDGDSAE